LCFCNYVSRCLHRKCDFVLTSFTRGRQCFCVIKRARVKRTAYRLQAKPAPTDFDLQPNNHTVITWITHLPSPEGWKAELAGWLTHSGRSDHMSTTYEDRSGKVCQPKTDVIATEPRRQHRNREATYCALLVSSASQLVSTRI